MTANLATRIGSLFDGLAVKVIMEAVLEFVEIEVDGFEESPELLEIAFEAAVLTAFVEVFTRQDQTEGAEPFTVDSVVCNTVARLERVFGNPQNPVQARKIIREYIDEARSRKQ